MFSFINLHSLLPFAYALVILIVGYLLGRFISHTLIGLINRFLTRQQSMLLSKLIHYLILIIFFIAALQQLGFKLSVLLSAAGVITVGVGIASQTSIANIISGLFLIGERPFVIGDFIGIDANNKGEVLSIDLLSVKLRTVDNTLVRIPNEQLIKSAVTNFTRFDTRRFDCLLGVAYKANLQHVKETLMAVAASIPIALATPPPQMFILNFGDSAINLQFSVWCQREDLIELKNLLFEKIQLAFAAEQIDIPFPQRDVRMITN